MGRVPDIVCTLARLRRNRARRPLWAHNVMKGFAMPKKNRVQQVSTLNQEPNNLIAGELLPLDWKRPDMINLLSLAMWGLEEAIKVGNPGATQRAVEGQVQAMVDWDPANALAFIQETDSGDPRST